MLKNKKVLGVIGLVVLAGALGAFVYYDMKKRAVSIDGGIYEVTDNTFKPEGGQGIAVGEPTGAPALTRSTDFSSALTPEVKAMVVERLNATVERLEKDRASYQDWIMLGVYRKTIGDYEGARDAWVYGATLAPGEVLAFNNLADLYHYFLKDYKKSEAAWKKTVALKSDYIQGYIGLADLYKYSLTEKVGEIPQVLKDGIAKNPDSLDLKIALARTYKDLGQKGLAEDAYKELVLAAQRVGNTTLVSQAQEELNALVK